VRRKQKKGYKGHVLKCEDSAPDEPTETKNAERATGWEINWRMKRPTGASRGLFVVSLLAAEQTVGNPLPIPLIRDILQEGNRY
jgi:hypothetical protein